MSWRFNISTINENDREAKLKCRLDGFNASRHSANATVTNNTLVVTANMDGKMYELKVPNIDVGSGAVNCKPEKNEVKVIITKPNKEYKLQSKMPY